MFCCWSGFLNLPCFQQSMRMTEFTGERPVVAELKLKMWKMTDLQIFNLSSSTRGQFSSFTALFASTDHWSEKGHTKFWNMEYWQYGQDLQGKTPRSCWFLLFSAHASYGHHPLLNRRNPENPRNCPENRRNPKNPRKPMNPRNPSNPRKPEQPEIPERQVFQVSRVFRPGIPSFPGFSGFPGFLGFLDRYSGFSGFLGYWVGWWPWMAHA